MEIVIENYKTGRESVQCVRTLKCVAVNRLNSSLDGGLWECDSEPPRYQFIFENGMEMFTPEDAEWTYDLVGRVADSIPGTNIRIKFKISNSGRHTILGIK